MADGTLKFDTKVDDSGYVQGIQKMSSKQIKLQNDIKKTATEMRKLETSMKEMQNTKVPTQEYLDIQKQIEQAEAKLNRYLATEERMKATGSVNTNSQSWKNLQYNIQQARNTVIAAKADMAGLSSTGGAFTVSADTTKLDAMRTKYTALQGKMGEYNAKLSEVQAKENSTGTTTSRLSSLFSKLKSAFTIAANGLRKVGSVARTVGSAFGSLMGGVGRATRAVVTGARKMLSHMNPLKRLSGVFSGMWGRMILMSIGFMALTKALQGIATGFSAIVRSSPQMTSSLAQIKGNLYTAFQPILEACLPALSALFDALVKVTGALAQFISMMFGKSVKSSQEAAKAQYDQASALNKTADGANKAKKALKGLADFDELHNTNSAQDSSSGGSSENKIKPDFTTSIDESTGISEFVKALKEAWKKADFTEVGMIIAEKMNNAMNAMPWDTIQATCSKLALSVATFLNGAIYGLDWSLLGTTIGNAINTAIFAAQTFVNTFDWAAFGSGIGTGIDSAFKSVDWNTLSLTVSTGLNGIFTSLDKAISSIDFKNVGTTIAQSLNNLTSTIDWVSIGKTLSDGLNGAINLLYGFVTTYDFKGLGTSIGSAINKFLTNTDWKKLGMDLSGLAIGMLDSITSAIKAVNWQSLGKNIVDLISSIDWGAVITGIVDALIAAVNGGISLIFGIGEEIGKNIIEGLQNGISLSDIIKNAFSWVKKHIVDPIVNNVKKLLGIHSPSTVFTDIGSYIMQGMINGIKSLIETVKTHFKNLVKNIKDFFTSLPKWFSDTFASALKSIKDAFTLTSIKEHFSQIYQGIKNAFSGIADWFKDVFTTAWTNVKNVFSTGGKIFDGIKDGILEGLKAVINGLIGGINKVIKIPFDGLNSALRGIKSVNIMGFKPFDWIGEISTPQIPPLLATGTVVPPNFGNFLAILGDNKKETEVVSPLSTMKQAMLEALKANGGNGSNGPITLVVNLDGKEVFRSVVKQDKEYKKATGQSAFAY
jgi:hypothetical protein